MKHVVATGVVLVLIALIPSCHKNEPQPVTPKQPDPTPIVLDTNYNPVDPVTAPSIGFFLDDWQPKSFAAPANADATAAPTANPTDTVNIDLNKVVTKVPKYLFGNNVNSWMGQMVDGTNANNALMQYIKDLNPNVLRFPGGSISDLYFWNSPLNSPPADVATTIYNAGAAQTMAASDYWFGTHPVTDTWTISLNSYYSALQQANSTGMIIINYGYARYGKSVNPVATAAHMAADWVRYDNGRSKYWEIGNENGGSWEAGYQIKQSDNQDGQPQIITGALYGQHFKVFADSMRKAATDVGVTIKIGAQVVGNSAANSGITNGNWNADMFGTIGNAADFFIVHNYYAPWHQNSNATVVLNSALTETKAIATYVTSSATAGGVTMKPIALTEWNIESQGSRQKISAVAGMHAVLCLGEMLTNGFGQATRWDLANAWESGDDHGLFNNTVGGANSAESAWNPRPAFYYLYYFQKYLGDRLVTSSVSPSSSTLSAYSSTFSTGEAATVLVNRGTSQRTALINVNHFDPGTKYYSFVLVPGTDNGEFSATVSVNGNNSLQSVGGPLGYASIKPASVTITSGSFKVAVPARATVYVVVADKN